MRTLSTASGGYYRAWRALGALAVDRCTRQLQQRSEDVGSVNVTRSVGSKCTDNANMLLAVVLHECPLLKHEYVGILTCGPSMPGSMVLCACVHVHARVLSIPSYLAPSGFADLSPWGWPPQVVWVRCSSTSSEWAVHSSLVSKGSVPLSFSLYLFLVSLCTTGLNPWG